MAKTYISRSLLRFSLLAFALMIFTVPSSALVVPSATPEPVKKESTSVKALNGMSVEDFLALTPKKYKELTGEKLSLTQKISLKITQKKIRKALRNNEQIDSATMASAVDGSDFNIGGFILGLLLSIIGVLIAYLIGDSSVIKWAWIGFGVSLVIYLLAILL
jgi:hypothetical protein